MLSIGSRFGQYEITGELGVGGMGLVYRAYDSSLKRAVAVKILRESGDVTPDRIARFQREAELLASLNHPNIAQIYGVVDANGANAMVMELVEGPTLADRILEGPLSTASALSIARQIAAAIEVAHQQRIVHRDLKPANVKIRDDGTVKVLDFGIAKALPDTSTPAFSRDEAISQFATTQGAIIGTPAYMSPEQVCGKAVDTPTDIWAFGCLMFEMLSGRKAFEGTSVIETIGAVLADEPDWTLVPADMVALLARCLEKDPKQRLRHIGDWDLALKSPAVHAPAPASPLLLRVRPVAAMVTLLAFVLAALWWIWYPAPAAIPRSVISVSIPDTLVASPASTFAVSPDGQHIAITARGAAETPGADERLWIWTLASSTVRPIGNDDSALRPFWSPDGTHVGFISKGELKIANLSDGSIETSRRADDKLRPAFGGTWSRNNGMLLSTVTGGLERVRSIDSVPVRVTETTADDHHHELPMFLPDGRHFLYFRHAKKAEEMGIYVGDIDARPADQPHVPLVLADDGPLYVPNPAGGDGYAVFSRAGTLFAQRFSTNKLQLQGDAVAVATNVSGGLGDGWMSTTASGRVLAYATGFARAAPFSFDLVWVDRRGRETSLQIPPGAYTNPRVSPEGRRLAVTMQRAVGIDWRAGLTAVDLWVYDVETGARIRVAQEGRNTVPVWTADGKRIIFSSNQHKPAAERTGADWGNLYSVPADGSGVPERLTINDKDQALTGISPDGRQLFYTKILNFANHWEIMRVNLDNPGEETALVPGPTRRSAAEVSPDGQLICYRSEETGRPEVYIQTYPDMASKVAVSIGGGDSPIWSADSRELFYRVGDRNSDRVMAVQVERRPQLSVSRPRELFAGSYFYQALSSRQYHVAPDGRFIMLKRHVAIGEPLPEPKILLDMNWLEALNVANH